MPFINRAWNYYQITPYMLNFPLGCHLSNLVQGMRLDRLDRQKAALALLLEEMKNLELFRLQNGRYAINVNQVWREVETHEQVVDLAHQRLSATEAKSKIRRLRKKQLSVLDSAIKATTRTNA